MPIAASTPTSVTSTTCSASSAPSLPAKRTQVGTGSASMIWSMRASRSRQTSSPAKKVTMISDEERERAVHDLEHLGRSPDRCGAVERLPMLRRRRHHEADAAEHDDDEVDALDRLAQLQANAGLAQRRQVRARESSRARCAPAAPPARPRLGVGVLLRRLRVVSARSAKRRAGVAPRTPAPSADPEQRGSRGTAVERQQTRVLLGDGPVLVAIAIGAESRTDRSARRAVWLSRSRRQLRGDEVADEEARRCRRRSAACCG